MGKPSKTAFFSAARAWDWQSVTALLVAAPELVETSDLQGHAALHRACAVKPGSNPALHEPNGIRTVTALLDAGADLERAVPMDEAEGDFRATPLWYAVARGENFPLVEFLLRRRANASYSLWAAVWRDDEMVCRALLKSRPNLNLQAHGETPIFYAARLKRLATLAMLIDAGADPSIVDPKGRDALTIARERRLPEQIIEKLESLRHKLHGPLPKRA
ncbi:MAG TPA: ankyrin repeat domain-containing protein [Paraburkholderia sp.]|uniref:ankyrin repeat domain-containing protein n=1 Tax=Paraburkholderia sp. TaxID=1926495 RepID=UPI002C38B494|nr:ankyrin repeat domain-containing protein [Paraburkholderia sp.]HTR07964.1 ankyrin repeat domain-containing protein [Paraburkholderia sp.]